MVVEGKRREGATEVIRSPFDGKAVSEFAIARAADMEDAIRAAYSAREALRAVPTHGRVSALQALAERVQARGDEIAELIARESGKPIRYARAEVSRATSTLSLGAHTAATFGGEVLPADVTQAGER